MEVTGRTTNGGTSILPRIRALQPSLVSSDAKVAAKVLGDPETVVHSTVSDLAILVGTSPSSVVRFCQRIGFRGFQHLKIALAQELAPARNLTQAVVREGDPPEEILRKVVSSTSRALSESLATLDTTQFAAAVSAVGESGQILFVGVGSSAAPAWDAAHRFMSIGFAAQCFADVHTQHLAALRLGPEDVCITVSHTGSTKEPVEVTEAASSTGATTVAVTSFSRSPLIEAADLALVTGGFEFSDRFEAMASRIAHLGVLDALLVSVALANSSRAKSALEAVATVASMRRF